MRKHGKHHDREGCLEFLMLEDATWKKPRAHRTFQCITRSSLQSMLQAIAAHLELFVDTTHLLRINAGTYLEDQHIVLAWAWVQWQLKIHESVQRLNPALMGKLTVNMTEMDEAGYELVKGQILDCASGVDTWSAQALDPIGEERGSVAIL